MRDDQIEVMAKLLKSMSHPIRFKILCLLKEKEISVGDLRDQVASSRANITQHLNILRNEGVIDFRKDANLIYNRITDMRILALIEKMRQLYIANNLDDRKEIRPDIEKHINQQEM